MKLRPPPSARGFDLLAKFERLIEGLGLAGRMAIGSLFLAPLQYFRASPPWSVQQAVRRRRILPPLLFLLLGSFGLLEYITLFMEAAGAHDPGDVIAQHLQELRRLDPWYVAGRAGLWFLALWLASELGASVLARLLAQPREPLRYATLYLAGLGVMYFGLSVILLTAALLGFEGSVDAPSPSTHIALWIGWALFLVPVLLAVGLGVYAMRRLRRRHWLPRGRIGAVARYAVAAALPLALMALFTLALMTADRSREFGRAFSITAMLHGGKPDEIAQTELKLEASRCSMAGADLRCIAIVRSSDRRQVILDEVLSVGLIGAAADTVGTVRLSVPPKFIDWRPRIGSGDPLILSEAEPTPLSFSVRSPGLCAAMAELSRGAVSVSEWSIVILLSGYAYGRDRTAGFDVYSLHIVGRHADQLTAVIHEC